MLNINLLIASISDAHFILAKKMFSENVSKFVEMKNHKWAGTLLEIICNERHLNIISKDEFAKMFSSLFYNELNDKNCIRDYILFIQNKICDSKGNWHTEARAKKYTDFLGEKYVENAKNKKYTYDFEDAETIEYIADYINIVLAIVWEHLDKKNTEGTIGGLNFNIHKDSVLQFMELMYSDYNIFEYNNMIIDSVETRKENKANIFNDFAKKRKQKGDEKKEKDPKRVFAYFITWLIYLKISDENGYIFELEVE